MRKVRLPRDLVIIHVEVIVEATRVVEFSEGENKEQLFLNIGINKNHLWGLLKCRCSGPTIGGFDLLDLGDKTWACI